MWIQYFIISFSNDTQKLLTDNQFIAINLGFCGPEKLNERKEKEKQK